MVDETNVNCVPFDYKIENLEDTIQALKFHPTQGLNNLLASGGWDKCLKVWDVQYSFSNQQQQYGLSNKQQILINANQVSSINMNSPVLNLSWKPGSYNIAVSDSDGGINLVDLQTSQAVPIGKHSQGCKEVHHYQINQKDYLISGGWDGFLHLWDYGSPNPVMSLNLGKKIYTMSQAENLLVIGYEKRVIQYFNLAKIGHVNNFSHEVEFESNLKYQTRSICCFPGGNGYTIGSVEGRVAVKNINLQVTPKLTNNAMNETGDFSFRCHRTNDNKEIYSVNCVAFNKAYGTFATGGADGSFYFWDKKNKGRLKTGSFEDKAPITAIDYNSTGDLFAYAAGYDWGQGLHGNLNIKPRIGIHYLIDAEKKEKQEQLNNNYRK